MRAIKKTGRVVSPAVSGSGGALPVPAGLAARMRTQALSTRGLAGDSGGVLELAFFCDTTVSMFPFFETARDSMIQITERMAREKVRVRFAVCAYKNHGDEEKFDGVHPFVYQPFSDDPESVRSALAGVRKGGGGDGLCAVEDAFNHLKCVTGAAGPEVKRLAVVIGDMPPHGVIDSISRCPHGYDYREDVGVLHRKGFIFYSVFCSDGDVQESRRDRAIREYYRWIAAETGGKYLDLADIDALMEVLLGICMKSAGNFDRYLSAALARPALPAQARRVLLQLCGDKRKP